MDNDRLKALRVDHALYVTTHEQIEAVKQRLCDDLIMFETIDCAYVRNDIRCLVLAHEELRAKVAELEEAAQDRDRYIAELQDKLERAQAASYEDGLLPEDLGEACHHSPVEIGDRVVCAHCGAVRE